MLNIKVDVEKNTAETQSGGKGKDLCVEAVLTVMLIIYEIARQDERLARVALETIKDQIGEKTVEEIVAELDGEMTITGEKNGKLS